MSEQSISRFIEEGKRKDDLQLDELVAILAREGKLNDLFQSIIQNECFGEMFSMCMWHALSDKTKGVDLHKYMEEAARMAIIKKIKQVELPTKGFYSREEIQGRDCTPNLWGGEGYIFHIGAQFICEEGNGDIFVIDEGMYSFRTVRYSSKGRPLYAPDWGSKKEPRSYIDIAGRTWKALSKLPEKG